MFSLSLIEHNVPLRPHLLDLPIVEAIKKELQSLFLDKVIPNLGLCVSVYDIRSIDGGFVYPGDGASSYKVVFRLLMFRPFVGEILYGRIKASDARGLQLSLGFFDDILVPANQLPENSILGEDGEWVWKHESGELSMDLNEEVHFRVTDIRYHPIPIEQAADAKPYSPMEIIGQLAGDGLGLLSWWEE